MTPIEQALIQYGEQTQALVDALERLDVAMTTVRLQHEELQRLRAEVSELEGVLGKLLLVNRWQGVEGAA